MISACPPAEQTAQGLTGVFPSWSAVWKLPEQILIALAWACWLGSLRGSPVPCPCDSQNDQAGCLQRFLGPAVTFRSALASNQAGDISLQVDSMSSRSSFRSSR